MKSTWRTDTDLPAIKLTMVIRKQPVISWLLGDRSMLDKGLVGLPLVENKIHYAYLHNSLNRLREIAEEYSPQWGLPELVMPSFEEVMHKSAKSFYGIDHRLFREFYEDRVCGILLWRNTGTIVYGFGENTLHVWWFFQDEQGRSWLRMYFYVESTRDNRRGLYIWPDLTDDDELFSGDREERKSLYGAIADKIITYLAVKKYVRVETVVVPPGKAVRLDNAIKDYRGKEKVRNESGQEVIVMDSRWFRKIVNDNDIFVRGFFRFQNKKNERGEWYKELIFVDSYIRNGYHRNARIEDCGKG